MAYAHVQSKIAKAVGVTSFAVTFTSSNTTNNRILAVAGTAFLSQTYTCADDATPSSNTYTQDKDYSDSFNQHSHFFSANITNGGGSARTVTFTPSASGDMSTIIAEYSGLSTATGSSAVDTTGSNFVNAAGTTISVSASPNPTAANECAVAFFNDHAANTYTATSGTIRVQGASNEGQCCLIDVASVVGTTTLTATVSGNGNWDHENMVVYVLAAVVASGAILWSAQVATKYVGPAVLRYLFHRQVPQTNIATPTNTEFTWPAYPANYSVGPTVLRPRWRRVTWGTYAGTLYLNALTAATLSFIGNLAKQTNKPQTGTLSFIGNLSKLTSHFMTGTLSFTGALSKLTQTAKAATLSFVGGLNKLTRRVLTGNLSFSGALQKLVAKAFTGVLSFVGSLTKLTARGMTGMVSFAGSLTKLTSKVLTGGLSFLGSLGKLTLRALAGGLNFSGSLASQFISGAGHLFTQAFTATLSFTGSMGKLTKRDFTATLGSIGSGIGSDIVLVGERLAKRINGIIHDKLD